MLMLLLAVVVLIWLWLRLHPYLTLSLLLQELSLSGDVATVALRGDVLAKRLHRRRARREEGGEVPEQSRGQAPGGGRRTGWRTSGWLPRVST